MNRLRTVVAASVALAAVSVVTVAAPADLVRADDDVAISAFPYEQHWSDTSLITANDDWSGVDGFEGYRGDDLTLVSGTNPQSLLADGSGTPTNVVANAAANASNGGVLEVGGSDPTIAIQGSGTADAPHVVMHLDLTGRDATFVSYHLRDLDSSADNASQPVALHYRIGGTGPYTDIPEAYVADATDAGSATRVTPVTVRLPAPTEGQGEVYLRWMTTNADGNDELVGIDDIVVRDQIEPVITPGTPASDEVGSGSEVTLTVELDAGDPPFSYQWFQGQAGDEVGSTMVGTDSPSFTTPALGSTTDYWVRVTNDAGADDSETATLTVVPAVALAIDPATPASVDADGGESVTLAVDVTAGTGPIGYQWYRGAAPDTSNPVGTNSASFTTPALTTTTSYWVRVSNSVNTVDSATATVTLPCQATVEPISFVQGATTTSGCAGAQVTVEGIVVGDYEGPCLGTGIDQACALRGFYLQSRDADDDADPATSEGIFVFNGDADDVAVGDPVRVTGVVAEFQGQTQINLTDLTVLAPEPPATPATVTLPMASATDFERYEGMLVTFPQELTVTETFHMGRSGEVRVSSGGRLQQPSAVVDPGPAAVTMQAANLLNYFIIDDAENTQNPEPYVYAPGGGNMTAANPLRGGDTVTGATGVMTYTWAGFTATGNNNAYRLRPQSPAAEHVAEIRFVSENPRPADPPAVDDDGAPSLRIVGFNVLNYFRTLDTTNSAPFPCGVIGAKQECRGANNSGELTRQHDKLIAALLDIDADVYGFAELENTEVTAGVAVDVLGPIIASLNAATEPGRWAAVDTGLIGTDTIRVGLIYRTDRVAVEGDAVMTAATYDGFDDDNNRPTLAVSLRELATDEVLTVAVNHWKSKGSCPGSGPDADQGDGAACWNAARVNAAQSLLGWLATNPTELAEPDPDVLVFGDLNSYAQEAPIDVLIDAGYVDVVQAYSPGAYSYVFDGQWGTLDYALASPSLVAQVTGAADYHINADEPPILDYNTEFKTVTNQTVLYDDDQFRTSDHDPAVVGVALDSVRPTPTVGYGGGDVTSAAEVTFNVEFHEPVVAFGPGDVTVTGPTGVAVASVSDLGGGEFAVVISVAAGAVGVVEVSVAAGAVTDLAGNPNEASGTASVEVDRAGPVAVVSYDGDIPTNAALVSFAVAFGEAVVGFAAADVELAGVAGASVGSVFDAGGGEYLVRVNVPAGADGALAVAVGAGGVTDGLGNANPASNVAEATVDRAAPTAVVSAEESPIALGDDAVFTVGFGEAVTAAPSVDDLAVVGTSVTPAITGTGPEFTVTFAGVGEPGVITLGVSAGAVTDLAGNASAASAFDASITVTPQSAEPPEVVSPIEPSRYWDTREGELTFDGQFQGTGRLGAEQFVRIQITGRGDVPADATGVVANLTAILPDGPGFATLYPCTGVVPKASHINYAPGEINANNVVVPLDSDGGVCVFTKAGADFALDVNGFVDASSPLVGINPSRYLDTRTDGSAVTFDGAAQATGLVPAEGVARVQIGGRGTVPLDATAVFVNVTAVAPEGNGYLRLYPCGALPATSTLNYATGQTVPNGALALLSPEGELCIMTKAATQVIVDVMAYLPAGAEGLTAITPERFADTRPGWPALVDGAPTGVPDRLAADEVIEVEVAGRGSVPGDATAVLFNVTAVEPDGPGYLTLFPCTDTLPKASNVNFTMPGSVRANNATTLLSPEGTVCVYAKTPVDVILDVMGYVGD